VIDPILVLSNCRHVSRYIGTVYELTGKQTEECDDNAVLTIIITLTRLYDAQEKL